MDTNIPPGQSVSPRDTAASNRERGRVAVATVIGTAVEWYDYFVYASAAGLVFGKLFFEPAGSGVGTILAFLTVGVSFLFRPLGAFLAGHFGDRVGRRPVLVTTLVLMGVATALIGVLPTYGAIGVWAPLGLVVLRIVQGISAGGEWGGAALMAVEYAPRHRRGLFGAMPQIGVPIGLLLASAMMATMDAVFPGEAFLDWGWRIPFLFSVVLIFVGWWVRRRVDESPVFAGNGAVGYMTTGGYIQGYATDPAGPLALDRGAVLWAVTVSSVSWLVATFAAGFVSDFLGRRATYLVGWFLQCVFVITLFPLVDSGSVVLLGVGLVLLTLGSGFTYGAQSAWYTELFPASVRFSGVSISYALGSILGGAFAPTVAQWIQQTTGSSTNVVGYLLGMSVIGLVATLLLRDRSGIDLSPSNEAQQEAGIYVWQK